jgi:hypothetical protein
MKRGYQQRQKYLGNLLWCPRCQETKLVTHVAQGIARLECGHHRPTDTSKLENAEVEALFEDSTSSIDTELL